MKRKHLATISLLALGLGVGHAQETKSTTDQTSQPATQSAQTFTDTQLVEEFGWFIGKRVGLSELEFSKAEIDALLKGMSAAAAGKDSPYDLEQIGPAMDEFMQKKQAAYLAKLKEQNVSANLAFFNKLKEEKNVVALPSGLHYEIIKQGDGPSPKEADTVKVHYTGKLIDGTAFDSSVERGEPAEFALSEVIPGWTEGIQKARQGGKIKLYVPPQLGYGDEGRPGIPPGSTLVFEVDLLDVKSAPAAAGRK